MPTEWNWKQKALIAGGAAIALLVFVWIGGLLATRSDVRKAEGFLARGYPALAAELLESRREGATKFEKGCSVITAAYYFTQNMARLDWAAQSCQANGIDTPEVQLAIAAVQESRGMDQLAFQTLSTAAARYDTLPDFYTRIAKILLRNKDQDGALAALMKAAERTTDNAVALEALKLAHQLKHWTEARTIAERLKETPSDDPELKLVLARSIKNGGDANGAHQLSEQARTMLASARPDRRSKLEHDYADVLGEARAPSSKK